MQTQTPPEPVEVRHMFDRLAGRYDLFNSLTSMGLDSVWRSEVISRVQPGDRVLDLGCGTGDLALEALGKSGPTGFVAAMDFSAEMLAIAKRRLIGMNYNGAGAKILFVERSAEDLPLPTDPFDIIISGFVLRNLHACLDAALRGMYASLRPGGRLCLLDFVDPGNRWVSSAWKLYMNTVVSWYGRALFGADYPMRYMTDSAARFPRPHEFVQRLERAGFSRVQVRSRFLGMIAIYEAVKFEA